MYPMANGQRLALAPFAFLSPPPFICIRNARECILHGSAPAGGGYVAWV